MSANVNTADYSGMWAHHDGDRIYYHQFCVLKKSVEEVQDAFKELVKQKKAVKGDELEVFRHVLINNYSYQRFVGHGVVEAHDKVKFD